MKPLTPRMRTFFILKGRYAGRMGDRGLYHSRKRAKPVSSGVAGAKPTHARSLLVSAWVAATSPGCIGWKSSAARTPSTRTQRADEIDHLHRPLAADVDHPVRRI